MGVSAGWRIVIADRKTVSSIEYIVKKRNTSFRLQVEIASVVSLLRNDRKEEKYKKPEIHTQRRIGVPRFHEDSPACLF